ncbi:protein of unknown function [Shinella sp. WSC3-e]|nr:hypothetical protein SHINE37_42864 [Rhizobiaceae bacterium]CAK7257433.1 protein of unknown function [Shinella sp. WSC3-e]
MAAFRKIHIPPLRFATCSRFQKEFLPCRIKQRASMIDGAYTTAQAEAQTEAYHLSGKLAERHCETSQS